MLKKYALFPLLGAVGGLVRAGLTTVFARPISSAVALYLGTQTNLLSEAASDISDLAAGLFSGGVSKSEQNKKFANDLVLEFKKEFNKFNEDKSQKDFKDIFHGYYTLILVGEEEKADNEIEKILKNYRNEFILFKNEFINDKKQGLTGAKLKIVKNLDLKLKKYPDNFENNFNEVIKGLKEKAKAEQSIDKDELKKELDRLSKPPIEEPIARTNVLSPFEQKMLKMQERRRRRQGILSGYTQGGPSQSNNLDGDLKLAFYDFINNMPDKKHYDNYLREEGISSDYVFNEIKHLIPMSSRRGPKTILMNDIENAFCNYISGNYKYGKKFKKTCLRSQYNKPYGKPPNSLGTALEKEVGEGEENLYDIYRIY